jgi:hypothetical protein
MLVQKLQGNLFDIRITLELFNKALLAAVFCPAHCWPKLTLEFPPRRSRHFS